MARRLFSPLEVDTFFSTIREPEQFAPSVEQAVEFIRRQKDSGRRLALVTSGGTIVPLEQEMVRFLDNFSAGSRGAISAEYARHAQHPHACARWFLRAGYGVIFLHRQFSMTPFARKYRSRTESLLDYLVPGGAGRVELRADMQAGMRADLDEYTRYREAGALLQIPFWTVSDYLYLLMRISVASMEMGSSALVYLAAAVSDFYLPEDQVSQHKIQSEAGTLTLKLEPVPKLIDHIVAVWNPRAFVVSFKLETDPALLLSKSQGALQAYKHQVVVANLLKERKRAVAVVHRDGAVRHLEVGDPAGEEIEEQLVGHLVQLHTDYI